MKAAFIINPISGTRSKKGLPEIVKNVAQKNGIDVSIVFTERAGHGISIAKELVAQHFDRIIAVGGDGTINEIGSQLIGTQSSLGIIPLGSGNGLARHLHISMNASKAIEAALQEEPQLIDTASINGKVYLCTAGVGFDALISNKFAAAGSRGLRTYAQISIKEYFNYTPQTYKITIDGVTYSREAFLITVANAAQYGNNAYIAPKASIQDGLLDVVVVSPFPLIESPTFAARMFLKTIDASKYTECFTGHNITIERQHDDYVHFDGEPDTMPATLNFKIVPASLSVIF